MSDLSQEKWCSQLKNDPDAVIIDVRTDEEIEEGCIPGAISMDIHNTSVFYTEIQKLDPSKHYYIYCKSGGRSGQACALLKSLGIEHAYNLIGGISGWKGEITK